MAGLIMPESESVDSPAAAFITVEDGKAKQIGTTARGTEEGFFRIFDQPSGFVVLVTDEHVQDRFLQMFSHEGERIASLEKLPPVPGLDEDVLARIISGSDTA